VATACSSGNEALMLATATASPAPQAAGAAYTYTADTPIDPEHARAVMQKKQSGATLSADEQAYLDRVRQMLQKQGGGKGGKGAPRRDPVAKAPASSTRADEWQHLSDGSSGKELDYTGVGGISLPGYFRKPEGNGPFPAIVFLHGGKAFSQGRASMLKQGQTTTSPIEDFLKQGWVVYAIDYRPTDNPVTSVLDPREIDDTVEAVKTLRQLALIDPERIGIAGGSHGAQLSTRLISRLNLKGAVICAPACFELPETQKAIAKGAKINKLVVTIIAAAEHK
jgi:dipeptidyl aminopeptidase/acylaminoacyl peptidase